MFQNVRTTKINNAEIRKRDDGAAVCFCVGFHGAGGSTAPRQRLVRLRVKLRQGAVCAADAAADADCRWFLTQLRHCSSCGRHSPVVRVALRYALPGKHDSAVAHLVLQLSSTRTRDISAC